MVDTLLRKLLAFVLLVTARMVFNDPNPAQFTRTLGSSIILNFTFNDTFLRSNSHVAVYTTGQRKIAERRSSSDLVLMYQNTSVSYHMEKLQLNGTGVYWASVFTGSGPARESGRVQLLVQDVNGATVPPLTTHTTRLRGSSNFFAHITVVVALVVVVAVLPLLVWCVVRAKDKQQQQQQHSTDTVQETVAPPSSLIYSVLDFARTPPAALDSSPSDTEYTVVSCPSETRRM